MFTYFYKLGENAERHWYYSGHIDITKNLATDCIWNEIQSSVNTILRWKLVVPNKFGWITTEICMAYSSSSRGKKWKRNKSSCELWSDFLLKSNYAGTDLDNLLSLYYCNLKVTSIILQRKFKKFFVNVQGSQNIFEINTFEGANNHGKMKSWQMEQCLKNSFLDKREDLVLSVVLHTDAPCNKNIKQWSLAGFRGQGNWENWLCPSCSSRSKNGYSVHLIFLLIISGGFLWITFWIVKTFRTTNFIKLGDPSSILSEISFMQV